MNTLKSFILLLVTAVCGCLIFGTIHMAVVPDYRYNRQFEYAWSLADKASTLEAKAARVSEFITNIETNRHRFADYDAVWLKTPDNNFEQNFTALNTLKTRLNEIKGMDPNSFQYQSAMQQITGQEMSEAHAMLFVLRGCWILKNYPLSWHWIHLLLIFSALIWSAVTLFCWGFYFDDLSSRTTTTRVYRSS